MMPADRMSASAVFSILQLLILSGISVNTQLMQSIAILMLLSVTVYELQNIPLIMPLSLTNVAGALLYAVCICQEFGGCSSCED